jgi:hypothetical protein
MERPLFVPASSRTLSHICTRVLIPSFAIGSDDGVDPECGDMMVPDVLEGNVNDHGGPYNGIRIGTQECTP